MKVKFNHLFTLNKDGTLTPNFYIRVGGLMISPGITFNKSILLSGINLFDYLGYEVEVDCVDGIYVIKGFYL